MVKRGWIWHLFLAMGIAIIFYATLYFFTIAISAQPPLPPAPVEEEKTDWLNLLVVVIIIGCIAYFVYEIFPKGEKKEGVNDHTHPAIDKQLLIYAGIFITAIVGFVFVGMAMALLIGGIGGMWLLWKYFSAQQPKSGLVTYEIADEIAELQRFHGMRLRTERNNIAGLYLPALELHLISFVFENLVFQKLKNGMIVGPDVGSLHAVLDHINNTQNLFSAPAERSERKTADSEEED